MNMLKYPNTKADMVAHLERCIGDVTPEFEIREKAAVAVEINRLKQEKKALILGHNYMEPALFHSVPDYTGDSLELSRIAARSECEIIVFCGVRFMAETAKILNPARKVLLPSPRAGCSLAESIAADDVRLLKKSFPGVPVVSYVNTYADVKAESDYCCTSSNGAAVVRHLQQQGYSTIIFLPDEFLASNIAAETGMKILFPKGTMTAKSLCEEIPTNLIPVMIGWKGRCEVHEKFSLEDVENIRRQFPDVTVLAHPECRPEVLKAADFSGSTSAMISFLERQSSGRYLLLTECSMADNIASKNPRREMLRLCSVRCPHMNEITLEQTLEALRSEKYEITVPENIRVRAFKALERMLNIQ